MDGALTPSDPVYIWLAIIQLVAMVLLPLQWRGLGENVLLGKQRSVLHMEMRKNDSPAAACQVGHTIFNISVNARVCLFYSFSVFLRLCAQLYIWGWGGVAVCKHAWLRICLSVQPCVTSSICSPAALPSEGG